MAVCTKCALALPEQALFCPQCGSPRTPDVQTTVREDPEAKEATRRNPVAGWTLWLIVAAMLGLALLSVLYNNFARSPYSTGTTDNIEKRQAIEQYWDPVNADFASLVATMSAAPMSSDSDAAENAKVDGMLTKLTGDADGSLPAGVPDDVKNDIDSTVSNIKQGLDTWGKPGNTGSPSDIANLHAQMTIARQRFEDAVGKVRVAYSSFGGDPSLIPDASEQQDSSQ